MDLKFAMERKKEFKIISIDFMVQNLIQATKKKLKCDLRQVTETKQNINKKIFHQNKSQNLIQTTYLKTIF